MITIRGTVTDTELAALLAALAVWCAARYPLDAAGTAPGHAASLPAGWQRPERDAGFQMPRSWQHAGQA